MEESALGRGVALPEVARSESVSPVGRGGRFGRRARAGQAGIIPECSSRFAVFAGTLVTIPGVALAVNAAAVA